MRSAPVPQHMTSAEKHRETVKHTSSAARRNRQQRGPNLHYFARWDRDDQLKAFLTWLPTELHDAPGIDWTQLTSDVMGYLIRQFENSADAAVMAVAAASMYGAIDQYSQRTRIKKLGSLLQNLRATTPIQCLADLKQEQIWFDWAAKQEKKEGARQKLIAYAVSSTGYFPRYLRRLTPEERQRMQHYALPPLPVDFFEKCFPYK